MLKANIADNLSALFFILLFPGFFFYHYAVAKMYIPPLLGGYFGVISLAGISLMFIFGYRALLKLNLAALVLGLILILTISVAALNYLVGNPPEYYREIFIWSISGVVYNFLLFFLGRYFYICSYGFYFVLLLMMALLVLFNVGDAGIFYLKGEAGEYSDEVATYQGFGRSLLVLALVLSAYAFNNKKIFIFVFLVSVAALFFNGARTEFVLYLVAIFALYMLYAFRDMFYLLGLFMTFILVGLIGFFAMDFLPSSRMFQLLDISSASSFQSRSFLLEYSVKEMLSNPANLLVGSYGHYTAVGGIGSYPHNIFSAWVNLGIVGFVLYLVLVFILWFYAFSWYGLCGINIYRVYFAFLVVLTLALLFSKDYSYMLVGFVVGLSSQMKSVISMKFSTRC